MPILNKQIQVSDERARKELELIAENISAQWQPFVASMVRVQKNLDEIYSEPIRAMQESVKKLAESFTPPVALIATFKQMAEQQAKMVQNLISISPPKIIPDNYLLRSEALIGPIKPRSECLLEYQNQLLEELLEKREVEVDQKPFEYFPETKTFVTRVVVHGAINFSTRRGTDSMSILFEILYKLLEERGVIQNGYKTVFATGNEILQRATQKGIKNADMNWLKHTRSNLVNSKIPHELKEIVVISEYNNQGKGYEFKIRVGEYLVN